MAKVFGQTLEEEQTVYCYPTNTGLLLNWSSNCLEALNAIDKPPNDGTLDGRLLLLSGLLLACCTALTVGGKFWFGLLDKFYQPGLNHPVDNSPDLEITQINSLGYLANRITRTYERNDPPFLNGEVNVP
jgi:hypothetical protein